MGEQEENKQISPRNMLFLKEKTIKFNSNHQCTFQGVLYIKILLNCVFYLYLTIFRNQVFYLDLRTHKPPYTPSIQ